MFKIYLTDKNSDRTMQLRNSILVKLLINIERKEDPLVALHLEGILNPA